MNNKKAYLFLLPFVLFFFVFTILPVISSIILSFFQYDTFNKIKFIFLNNYLNLLFNDHVFQKAVKNTFIIAIIAGPIGYFLSFIVAWMINKFEGIIRNIFVTIFFAPSISGNAYLIWKVIFSSDEYGYLNNILINLKIIDTSISFLEDSRFVLWIIILITLWMSFGTGFLGNIAGMKNINKELYDAGKIDGIKNSFQELIYITIPSMKSMLLFSAVMQITSTLATSSISLNMAGLPSVDYSAHTIGSHLIDYGSIRYEFGYASAIATVLFLIMILLNNYIQRKADHF